MNTIRIFNEKEVDELVVLDISDNEALSLDRLAYLSKIASSAFMPMAYGGKVRTIQQVRALLRGGYEKIVLNSCLQTNPQLISQAAIEFGSQAVVASLDVRKAGDDRYIVWIDNGRYNTHVDVVTAACRAHELGAGELYLRNIDFDGEMQGYDTSLIQRVAGQVPVPVVAIGGAGSLEHLRQARAAGASAAAAGSFFIYQGRYRAVLISYPNMEDRY